MTRKAFTEILAGIGDAVAFAEGDTARGVAHVPEIVDVKALRARFGLTRKAFADRFGFDARAVQDWEQGRRAPDRAARVLLRVIEREPEAVERALAG